MLPRFIAWRQGLLPDDMPLQDFMNFWYKKISAALLKSMVAERRIELLGVLADEHRVFRLKYPSNFTSMCQELLYESTTRFQHARLRQISLIRSNVVEFFCEWDQAVPHTAETKAISTICRDPGSGLRGLAALSDKMLIDENVERIGKMRAEWDDLGHYSYAMAADWFQVATLLDKNELTVKSTSAELVPTLIKRMYDGERLLWGKAEPRTGHWSWLFHSLHEKLVELETQRTFNIAGTGVILAATIQLCRRADADNRNPTLVQLEHVLDAALELLARYKAVVHGHVYPPKLIPALSRELCSRLLTLYTKAAHLDGGGTPTPNIKTARSLTMGTYLDAAEQLARHRPTSPARAQALEKLEALARAEALQDDTDGLRLQAIYKVYVLTVIALHHPARSAVLTIEQSGAGEFWAWANRLVDDDAVWRGNEAGRAQARTYLAIARGRWLAWTDEKGQPRGGKTVGRRTPGEPGGEDYWTWDWEWLGRSPDAVGNGETVEALRGKQEEWEGSQMAVRVRWDGFLEKCLEAAGEGLGLGGEGGVGLFDEGRYPWG